MKPTVTSVGLLVCSNVFMSFARFEYLFQVPANRIGYTVLSVGQLKILQ